MWRPFCNLLLVRSEGKELLHALPHPSPEAMPSHRRPGNIRCRGRHLSCPMPLMGFPAASRLCRLAGAARQDPQLHEPALAHLALPLRRCCRRPSRASRARAPVFNLVAKPRHDREWDPRMIPHPRHHIASSDLVASLANIVAKFLLRKSSESVWRVSICSSSSWIVFFMDSIFFQVGSQAR